MDLFLLPSKITGHFEIGSHNVFPLSTVAQSQKVLLPISSDKNIFWQFVDITLTAYADFLVLITEQNIIVTIIIAAKLT